MNIITTNHLPNSTTYRFSNGARYEHTKTKSGSVLLALWFASVGWCGIDVEAGVAIRNNKYDLWLYNGDFVRITEEEAEWLINTWGFPLFIGRSLTKMVKA